MALIHLTYYTAIIISCIFLLHFVVGTTKSVFYYSGADFSIDLYVDWIGQAISKHITLLLVLFVLCWSMVYLNFCVHSIYNKVKPISSRELLRDQTPASSTYSYEPSLTITAPNNKSVILLIHGAWQNPAFLKPIINHITINHQDYDIATSLLHKHGGTLQDLLDFNYTQAYANIKADIDYLSGKYDKVLCIGHSLGGLILSDLSVQNNINPNKISMILYEPAIIARDVTFIEHFGYYTLGMLFDFMINADVGSLSVKDPLCYAYSQVPVTKSMLDALFYQHAPKVLESIINNGNKLNNNFGYILSSDSNSIKSSDIKDLLDKDTVHKKIGIFEVFPGATNTHTLHSGTNPESIKQFLDKLSDTIKVV